MKRTGSRTVRRANTKTKVKPGTGVQMKPPKFKYPPRTKYHRRKGD